jgi:hypothetical protein
VVQQRSYKRLLLFPLLKKKVMMKFLRKKGKYEQLLLFYCFAGIAGMAMKKGDPKNEEGFSLHEVTSLMQGYMDGNVSVEDVDGKLHISFNKYNYEPTFLRASDRAGYSRSLEQAAECLYTLRGQATDSFDVLKDECEEKLKEYQSNALDDLIIFKLQQIRLGMFCLHHDLPLDSKNNVEREKVIEARNLWENAILCNVKSSAERSLKDKTFVCRLLPLRKILASEDILKALKRVEEAKESDCLVS